MHYSIAVITKNGNYEDVLEPYNENLEVEPYLYKTRNELIKEKRDDLLGWDETSYYLRFLQETFDYSSDEALFNSIKEYMSKDEHYSFDDEGNLYATWNRSPLWDYYRVGGRFSGTLVLKENIKPKHDNSFYDILLEYDKDNRIACDHAQVKDIDFIKTCEQDKEYLEYSARFWDVYVEGFPRKSSEKKSDYESIIKKEWFKENYGDKQTYLNSLCSFPVCALMTETKIIAPSGDSAFYWMDKTEIPKTHREFLRRKGDLIASLNPTDWITIVDCHL